MTHLVMIDLASGPDLVDALARVWASGDAVFVLDQRLPRTEVDRLLAVVRPTAVIESDGQRRSLDGEMLEPGDALVVATSGTTGQPKAVIHTHESVQASAQATSAALSVDPALDHWLCCLPPAHIAGLAVIARALLTGTGLTVHDRFDAQRVEAAADAGATLVSLVTRALNQVDTDKFRSILIGGAAPPRQLPDNVIATYGMTETGSGCVYGGYPLAGVELRTSSTGEIEIRSPILLRTYRTLDGHMNPLDAHGWFATADLGRIEPDGRLWVDGRNSDMIITGGQNVWPSRVERRLQEHPLVGEAAVFATPSDDWGHVVTAWITLAASSSEPGIPDATESDGPKLEELREWVRAELPTWYAPKEMSIVSELPKTALGKVRRDLLGKS